MLGPKKFPHSLRPATRLGDRSQGQPQTDEACALRLLCTQGTPSGSRSLPGFWILRSTAWEEPEQTCHKGNLQGVAGPLAILPPPLLLSILGAKGQNVDHGRRDSSLQKHPELEEQRPLPRMPARPTSPSWTPQKVPRDPALHQEAEQRGCRGLAETLGLSCLQRGKQMPSTRTQAGRGKGQVSGQTEHGKLG